MQLSAELVNTVPPHHMSIPSCLQEGLHFYSFLFYFLFFGMAHNHAETFNMTILDFHHPPFNQMFQGELSMGHEADI